MKNVQASIKVAKQERRIIKRGYKHINNFVNDCVVEPENHHSLTRESINVQLKNELLAIVKDYLAWQKLSLVDLVIDFRIDKAFTDVLYAVPQKHVKLLDKACDTNKLSDYKDWINTIGLMDLGYTDLLSANHACDHFYDFIGDCNFALKNLPTYDRKD